MIERMQTGEAAIKTRARSIVQRIHPDKLATLSPEDEQVGASLVPFLEKILKRPEDMDHWGDDIDNLYPKKGSVVTIAGLAPDGRVRAPRQVALRKPSDFLAILEAYLDTGDIPVELLETPYYDPTPFEDEYEMSFEPMDAVAEADDAAKTLKEAIQTIEDYDHGYSVHIATKISPQHNMRLAGVLSALDERMEMVIAKEIEKADTAETLQLAEDHVHAFPFDDKNVAHRLFEKLHARAADVVPKAPRSEAVQEFLHRTARAKSSDALLAVVEDAKEHAFATEEERIYVLKNCDTAGKLLFLKECGKNTSVRMFAQTFERAMQFPFSDMNYGFTVLDDIEMRAKYFILGQILRTQNAQDLVGVAENIKEFPFRHKENVEYLHMQIDAHRRKQRLYR